MNSLALEFILTYPPDGILRYFWLVSSLTNARFVSCSRLLSQLTPRSPVAADTRPGDFKHVSMSKMVIVQSGQLYRVVSCESGQCGESGSKCQHANNIC